MDALSALALEIAAQLEREQPELFAEVFGEDDRELLAEIDAEARS